MKTKTIFTTILAIILCLAGSEGLEAKKKKDRCDLIVRSLSAPSRADSGSKIRILSRVKNKGRSKAKKSYTKFYLSENGKLDSSDLYLGKVKVPALKKKKTSKKYKKYVTIPEWVPSGKYFLIAKADGTKKNKEKSEKNNYKRRSIRISQTNPYLGEKTAEGTYTYNSEDGTLNFNITSSDFRECGPEAGPDEFIVSSVTSTTMIWDDPEDDDSMSWTRDSGSDGVIVDTWQMSEGGNLYTLTIRTDGSLTVLGDIVNCGPSEPAATSYSIDDLAGTWEGNSLASGPGAPWWHRTTMTVNADGTFTVTAIDSDGSTGNGSGTLLISSGGAVTMKGDPDSIKGSMDSGKTVMVWTGIWDSGSVGTTEIMVFTKKSASYSIADLAGTWEANSIASGPGAPWWLRGPLTINSDGSFLFSETYSDGTAGTSSGTISIATDGIITTQAAGPDFRAVMDSGKTVIVGTSTWSNVYPGTTQIVVWTKKAASYSIADLVGTWESNSLASGPGAPWWERSTMTVNADGTFTATAIDSDGSPANISGTLSISSGGILTIQGNPDGIQGSMDSGKTVMAWTGTWDSGSVGTTEIKVFTKRIE